MERKSIHNPSVPASNSHPASSSSPIIHKKYLKVLMIYHILALLEFSNLAHDHPDSALTNEMSRSHVGGMSHFNCLYHVYIQN